MLIKTILNKLEKYKSFVYGKVHFEKISGTEALVIQVLPRKNGQGLCVECQRPCPGYDTQPRRYYRHVPLWNIPVYFHYSPRRVE